MEELFKRYQRIRAKTLDLCGPLEKEEFVVQPHLEASPPKWHLAHTTWFFEHFILKSFVPSYRVFHEDFHFLFNSYYESQGHHWARERRGHLARPLVEESIQYRHYVDEHLLEAKSLLENHQEKEKIEAFFKMGIQHEEQHHELLLMDIKSILGGCPIKTAYQKEDEFESQIQLPQNKKWIFCEGGLIHQGLDPNPSLHFDIETPRHQVFLQNFFLNSHLVTNGEYLEFIESGEAKNPLLWKSDGWSLLQGGASPYPLYWEQRDGEWFEYHLNGFKPLDLNRPLCHLNFYEADAFAKFSGARLPTETELEFMTEKNFSPSLEESSDKSQRSIRALSPVHNNQGDDGFSSLWGELWQWTMSSYLPYPGYQRPKGALGEYNEKFTVNQTILRGGAFATASDHWRPTYRNFFYPDQKWAFTGLRLAKDVE